MLTQVLKLVNCGAQSPWIKTRDVVVKKMYKHFYAVFDHLILQQIK